MKILVVGPTERELYRNRRWYESAFRLFGSEWILDMDSIQLEAICEDTARDAQIKRIRTCQECGSELCGMH